MDFFGIRFQIFPKLVLIMIERSQKDRLISLAATFKSVAVIGSRQSGKTTLVKYVFPDKKYVNLENLDERNFAIDDPRGFLEQFKDGGILDEVQRVPHLFSYLQEILDSSNEKGLFILSGSNNFLLQENISQSLAGRIAYLNLLPFSINELSAKHLPSSDLELMIKGFYPPVYDQQIPPEEWYPNYLRTYVEKDVRQLKNIMDLHVFERFIRLLAGRSAQELNSSALSVEVGVSVKTIQSWIGVLESSFIIFLLRPHFKNFNKTIVKRPKVYFHDTGLACYLLGINDSDQLENYPTRGALFENMLITELFKQQTIHKPNSSLYYWRDKSGHEIDLIT